VEQGEAFASTIELAHARIMSWGTGLKMRQVVDNNKTTNYVEAIYMVEYDWVYHTPLGIAGPYVEP
jgi:hypothetical protein